MFTRPHIHTLNNLRLRSACQRDRLQKAFQNKLHIAAVTTEKFCVSVPIPEPHLIQELQCNSERILPNRYDEQQTQHRRQSN
jgi:hypothetical protein